MRRLGDGVDWSRERFTMDEGLSRAVHTVFKKMFDDGLIYQAERLVNWSPVLKTAVSDIEVSYADVEGELVSFRYGSLDDSEPPHIVVATTRLETMLGDTAIAVHPRRRALCASDRHRTATPFPRSEDPGRRRRLRRPRIRQRRSEDHPRRTTPNDFALGQRHNLPMPTIMDESARIADTGTQFDGMDRFEARVKVREALAEQGRIVKEVRPYLHSVGHSERTGEPIEPRLSMQWWVDVSSLAQAAGDAVRDGSTVIHPKSMEPRWFGWVDDMHDWCISRQLWWGDIASRSGTARTARSCASDPMRRPPRRGTSRKPTSSTPGSPRACGRSPPWAGRRRPTTSRSSIPPRFSSPDTTSCSSGWRG